jgi:mono/diheme cytochrome c family protein
MNLRAPGLLAIAVSWLLGGTIWLQAAEHCLRSDRTAGGEVLYRVHCAACHGKDGRGEGPMAEILKVPPRDLTTLEQEKFSESELIASIDGRTTVRGHGSSEMPVWGLSFKEVGRDTPQEDLVRDRIQDLLCYLKTIQE